MTGNNSFKTAVRGEEETVVNKSRFICYIRHVENFEQAEAELAAIRKKHPSATHVCYGTVTDVDGNEFRYGDDGEPVGTAGMPILAVLRGASLRQTLAAVVRYFGGIKLGTGGLARAYGDSVKSALEKAEIKTFTEKSLYEITLNYTEYNALLSPLEHGGATITNQEFGENVTLTVALDPETDAESFIGGLLRRECNPKKIGNRYI